MLLLFLGTAVYNGSVKLRCFDYGDDGQEEAGGAGGVGSAVGINSPAVGGGGDAVPEGGLAVQIRTPAHLASPALMRSPFKIHTTHLLATIFLRRVRPTPHPS